MYKCKKAGQQGSIQNVLIVARESKNNTNNTTHKEHRSMNNTTDRN